MKTLFTFLSIFVGIQVYAQTSSIKGQLQGTDKEAVVFANIALHSAADSSLIKVETSNETGLFHFRQLPKGDYFLKATYVGLADLKQENIQLKADEQLDLGVLSFGESAIELDAATVKASRVMVEVKADRTVFNVEGTINSSGSDAISLLRKAPGVTVDNNDNINVLGRSGVLLYVDGKRLPLSGDDLSNYLQNIPAEQIDRIDIITNPGAKYEAEGNAGIIDIRLKKDKNLGANGTVNGNYSQGRYGKGNLGASGNYRNKKVNVFANVGLGRGKGFNTMMFESFQNGIKLDETNDGRSKWDYHNYRIGTDFYLSDQHVIGFLVSGRQNLGDRRIRNSIGISDAVNYTGLDSILVANSISDDIQKNQSYNINYRFDNRKGRSLNIDLDYGHFRNDSERSQNNSYYETILEENLISSQTTIFNTPSDIGIYTVKLDFEEELFGGKLGVGTKLSKVVSDNTFLVSDIINDASVQDNSRSNIFKYDENVYAGYVSFARPLGKKWNFSAGLRAEQTDAVGDLQAFLPEQEEEPVTPNYLSWFPNAGLTWQVAPKHSLGLNYGRRINRPDYGVLNPFENQLSELSYQKGNPFLRPEIVNNVELNYTLAYRYNFKLGYSKTTDQITRLIAPDENDNRANFITWENLANQTVIGLNISAPVQFTKFWEAYFNVSASHQDNQADYGEGAVVDVQVFTYSIYQQHTFSLFKGLKGEISGYYSGPGVWGGVFEYESNWSLNLGLQRKFLEDKLNVRLSANDIFYESGWDGVSVFDGLVSAGGGRWDSRRVSLSVSYNFGNQNVKSRKRKTGMEDEAGRVSSGN